MDTTLIGLEYNMETGDVYFNLMYAEEAWGSMCDK